MKTNPLNWLGITHDMFCASTHLHAMAMRGQRVDLQIASIAFTAQLAIENGADPTAIREMERVLMELVRSAHPDVPLPSPWPKAPLPIDVSTGPSWAALTKSEKP